MLSYYYGTYYHYYYNYRHYYYTHTYEYKLYYLRIYDVVPLWRFSVQLKHAMEKRDNIK